MGVLSDLDEQDCLRRRKYLARELELETLLGEGSVGEGRGRAAEELVGRLRRRVNR